MLFIGFQFMSPSWCDAFALITAFSRRRSLLLLLLLFIFKFRFISLLFPRRHLFSSLYSVLTNIGHPLCIWPITPVHAHYKLFSSKARTFEWTIEQTKKKSPNEENEVYCNTFTMAISSIRHVSCCFGFWLNTHAHIRALLESEQERERDRKAPPKCVYQSIYPSGKACQRFAMCEFLCAHILCKQNRIAENIHYTKSHTHTHTHVCEIDWCEFVVLWSHRVQRSFEIIFFSDSLFSSKN